MKFFDIFRKKKTPGAETREDFFTQKYQSFKKLLDANNDALEIMSRLETVAQGDFLFDMQYLRTRTTALLDICRVIIDELNLLGDNRYTALIPIYEGIKARIQEELTRGPATAVRGAWTLPLSQVNRRLLAQVGGKNANLGEIRNRVQLPTPDGFVITVEAYRQVLAENHLTQKLERFLKEVDPGDLAGLTEKSRLLREELLQARIPLRLAAEVNQQFERLTRALGQAPSLALRSSGLYEDQEFSFAGQFLTQLNVSLLQFFPSYLEILASQWSPRALVYVVQKGLDPRELAMSVGCLVMVPARASGVLFTEDPTGARPGVMVVEAAWGLGPTVVEGTLIPDRFLLSKEGDISILEQHLSPKTHRLRAAPLQEGLITEAVPEAESRQAALSPEELLQLGRYGRRLEEYFGEPQDIEFAVDDKGQVIILQSRPLTVSQPQAADISAERLRQHPILLDQGTPACFGVAAGPVFIIERDEDLARFPEGAVLVARYTSARYGSVIHKAAALVVDIGSATSHLAILAREFKVPALVDTEVATQVLKNGQEVTVDADHQQVYQGRLAEMLRPAAPKEALLAETPLYATLRRVLRWITPLHLTDPKLMDFKPESCHTLHDLTRFAHQMAIAEMFDLGEKASRQEAYMVRLKTPIPLNLYLIDLGGGIREGRVGKFVSPEDLVSIPMRALWKGISHPGVSWAGPIAIDVKGLYSVVSRSLTAPAPDQGDFWLRTLAIISRNYLNYSSRLGYHFATIDAYVSEVRNDNYISFRFKGGAADEYRRGLRARFLGTILEKLDFDTEVSGDLVVARLGKYPQPLMEEKLDLLGRLMACARQRDMVMGDDRIVDWYIQAFLEGNYSFAGEPR
ncbi:MAG: PEP/pyruvate-binding domain-containing protein [Desulfobaccales bacterium]